jgi:hypothetical protein
MHASDPTESADANTFTLNTHSQLPEFAATTHATVTIFLLALSPSSQLYPNIWYNRNRQKPNVSPGDDAVSNTTSGNFPNKVIVNIQNTLQACINQHNSFSHCPENAEITALHKLWKYTWLPENRRHISLLQALQVSWSLKLNILKSPLESQQFGFRQHRHTSHGLMQIVMPPNLKKQSQTCIWIFQRL